jgi:hypothetical protein
MNRATRRKIGRTLGVAAASASAIVLPLSIGPVPQAGASSYNIAHLIWGLFDGAPYTCTTQVLHETAYGGALASTGTADPVYGGTACWSTYTDQETAQGHYQPSSGGNPSSSVLYSGDTPDISWHVACYGLFDCDSNWYTLS